MVDAGDLGDTHAVQTDCLDQQDPTGEPNSLPQSDFPGFFVTFSAQSGGIFVDMGVHDVRYESYPYPSLSHTAK